MRDPDAVGYLTLGDRPARHICRPPCAIRPDWPGDTPADPVGTVWRCICGRLWQVDETPIPARGQVRGDRRVWQRAGWVIRWRYRHARALAAPEISATLMCPVRKEQPS